MKTIAVSADALHRVLLALLGPGHLIRELQATCNISDLMEGGNPIITLAREYDAALEASKQAPAAAEPAAQPKHPQFLYEHALNEVLMLGYTIKDGDLFPPETGIPVAPQTTARTDELIVEQTEDVARLLMQEFYRREPNGDLKFRAAVDPRGRHAWQVACGIQELLTNTDPENAVSVVDDGEPLRPLELVVVRLPADDTEGGAA